MYTIHMLSAKQRFHGHGSLRYVYKNSHAVRSHLFTVRTIKNPRRTASRIVVVVSKKVHKSAVGRNRIRRRLYEVLRYELPNFAGVYDVAVIVTSGEVLAAESLELTNNIRDLLKQSGVITQ